MTDLEDKELEILYRRQVAPPIRIAGMWSCCTGRCQASPRDAYCDCLGQLMPANSLEEKRRTLGDSITYWHSIRRRVT